VGADPRPGHLYPGKDPVHVVEEAGWAPGPVCTGGKSRPHRDFLFSFVYMDSFDITEQFSLLTRLACGHKTCSMTECRETVRVRVTRWCR